LGFGTLLGVKKLEWRG